MNTKVGHREAALYEFYREIADELCLPLNRELDIAVKFELYHSKLVYLKHLWQVCFKELNWDQRQNCSSSSNTVTKDTSPNHFTSQDLTLIKSAIDITNYHLCETVKESLHRSFAKAQKNFEGEQKRAATNRNPS